MPRTEYGGDGAGELRPDGTTRHVGTPVGRAEDLSPAERVTMLRLTGDETGASPVDLAGAWSGLDPSLWETTL